MEHLIDNKRKEEWINGIKAMSPRPLGNHSLLQYSIAEELQKYFKKSCKVVIEGALYLTKENPVDLKKDVIRLQELIKSKKAETVPDIAIYCDKEQLFRRGFLGIPQIIVEVLSPSNSTYDTETKKELYRSYGVPEYWIVSPESKTAHVYTLENDNYKLTGEFLFRETSILSERFKDLNVDVRDTWWYEENEDDLI